MSELRFYIFLTDAGNEEDDAGSRSGSPPMMIDMLFGVLSQMGNMDERNLFYDDGYGSGLRPMTIDMSPEPLNQLRHIFSNIKRAATKSAIESLRTIKLKHSDDIEEGKSNCAVCKEKFEPGNEVGEMPCKHIYHCDCIMPWLERQVSCPLCRDVQVAVVNRLFEEGEDTLTIRTLEGGGGFAVGRFAPVSELLVVYAPRTTEDTEEEEEEEEEEKKT